MSEAHRDFIQRRGGRLAAVLKCTPEEAMQKRWHIRASKKDHESKDFLGTPISFMDELIRLEVEGYNIGFKVAHSDPLPWPTPQPLAARVEPEPYPIEALPQVLRAAVVEVQGFVKAPVPLVASSALAAVSLAVQAHFDMERAKGLSGPVGLFMLTIAESGERKSSCDRYFMRAVREYQGRQADESKPRLKDFRALKGAWDAKVKGVQDAIKRNAAAGKSTHDLEIRLRELERAEPLEPRVPRLIYEDVTPEQLKWALAKSWPSGGVVSSEAGVVFGSHGMKDESVMRNLATYNQLWDGSDIATDRRGDGSYLVRGARLTMALQVQGPTLQAFMEKSGTLARGSGFLARFLVACPDSTQGNRPFTEAPASWPSLDAFTRRLGAILDRSVLIDADGALSPAMLTFSPEGKAAWVDFHNRIEAQLGAGGTYQDVRDVAAKIADNAARLAALFHVFEGAPGHTVGSDHFRSAARIAEWHLNESRRFFGELALPAPLVDAGRLETWLVQWIARTGNDLVPTKDVQQRGPAGLREKARIDAAMVELEELGRAQRLLDGRKKLIAVNPAVLGSRNIKNIGSTNPDEVLGPQVQPLMDGRRNSLNISSNPPDAEVDITAEVAVLPFPDSMDDEPVAAMVEGEL